MFTRVVLVLTAVAALLIGLPASAHEVRPAYLEVQQVSASEYHVLWKQPTMGEMAVHLVPHMSNGWLERPPTEQVSGDGYRIRTWTIRDATGPLSGTTVSIEGLEETVTDTLVRLKLADGERTEVLRPAVPRLTIEDIGKKTTLTTLAFFRVGVEHILRGPDHLLFLLGLLLLIVTDRGKLIKTITAFTIAHSITLAVATLWAINLSTPLLNALIALSILFLGAEIVRAQRGGTSLTIRRPWVAAFLFGLLHGFGFANGLTGLGLSKGGLASALVLFNLGVEAGQLGFIALVLALRRAFRLMEIRWGPIMSALPTYAVGSLGAFWTLQYVSLMFAPTN